MSPLCSRSVLLLRTLANVTYSIGLVSERGIIAMTGCILAIPYSKHWKMMDSFSECLRGCGLGADEYSERKICLFDFI